MAIYHFSAQVISRSQGRSSVASAAYRSSEKLLDERTGEVHDFTRKSDVLEKEILLPKDAPEWMSDREKLWNAVEIAETRKDAQLSREINVALPKELNAEQNWNLLKNFVQKEFVDQGMVADVAFHRGHKGGEEQPHGHVMLTMREITPEGFGGKVRAWNNKELLTTWREHWAEHCNRELARQGFDFRIDHRTLEAQGINLEPQSKIGPKAVQSSMARYAEHQALAARNGERLLNDPNIALTALTRQQSTFTHQDVARLVNRHTTSPEQFTAVYEKIKASPELVHLGQDEQQRDRYSTKEMLALESQMMAHATTKAPLAQHPVSFPSMTQAMASRSLSDEQKAAFEHLTKGGDVACVVGFAGTGKSYLLGAAREAWEAEGYRVHGMTLSGIAAENLENGSGIGSHTVANRLWHWEQDRERLTHKDIVVVDEAGMLGSRQMAAILAEVRRSGAKVALVGDPEQLQAIEAGAAFRAISEKTGFVELSEIRRQKEGWQQAATKDLASERTVEALGAYNRHDNIHTFDTKASAMTSMIEQWDEVRSQSPDKSQLILAYTRDDVRTLNEQARTMRHAQGELGKDHLIETSRGPRTFAEGDRVYFLRNENRELQVKNGTLGTIQKIEGNQLIVRLDAVDGKQARAVSVDLNKYNDLDHGYAATVHKAQGVTVDRTHVLASKHFDRHSTYVAMSRHRDGADLYVSKEDFPSMDRLSQSLSQERAKDVTLDYSKNRGFDAPETPFAPPKEKTVEQEKVQEVTSSKRAEKTAQLPLTEDRAKEAEKRLALRMYQKTVEKDIEALEKKTGLKVSMNANVGDEGIYRGTTDIASRKYGILEKADGSAKLIRADLLKSREKDQKMVIEKTRDYNGTEFIKAVQPEVERSRERDRGRSF
ncbi:MAG: Ti-type conjugative transfer relaxase TraA [Gammaproteobacteria bacterium]|nr:Ti-type conjugative transfer relaxase TraA [Gammaproteobacteria bacterium]